MNNTQCPPSRKPAKQCLKVPFSIIVTLVWLCKLLIQTFHYISFHVVLSWCFVCFWLFCFLFVCFLLFQTRTCHIHTFVGNHNIIGCSCQTRMHVCNFVAVAQISHSNSHIRVPFHWRARHHCFQCSPCTSVLVCSPHTAMACVYAARAPWRSSFPRRRAASCCPFTTTVP